MKKSSRNRRKQLRFQKLVRSEARDLVMLGGVDYSFHRSDVTTVRVTRFLNPYSRLCSETETSDAAIALQYSLEPMVKQKLMKVMQEELLAQAVSQGLIQWEPFNDNRIEAKISFVK